MRSDDADAVGHVQSVVILRQAHISLLLAVWADECVHLGSLHVVHGLHRLSDVDLRGLHVHDEYEGVDLLDFLHGRLGRHRVANDAVLVHLRPTLNRPLWVLRVALPLESLRAEEVHARPDPLMLPRDGTLDRFGHLGGLLGAALLRWLIAPRAGLAWLLLLAL